MDRWITEHFKWDEIRCKHCKSVRVIPRLWQHMELLEKLRTDLAYPIIINSGYRCSKHNKDVGGARLSQHLLFATDVRPRWVHSHSVSTTHANQRYKLKQIRELSENLGFSGIGIYEWFIHLDLRAEPITWRNST